MRTFRGATALVSVLALCAAPQVAAAEPVAPPTSIAALGDSITRGFNACGYYRDCPDRSWSTGSDDDVQSHRRWLLEAGGTEVRTANLARSGARASALRDQAVEAVKVEAEYVTIAIGANDACARTPATMTPVEDYRASIRAALAVLRDGLPQARVFVASVPDLWRVWQVGHGAWYIRQAWKSLDVCPSMLARSNSLDRADMTRRDRVRARVIAYNSVLAEECAAFGSLCRTDRKQVYQTTFSRGLLSKWDFFHPNTRGQDLLATVTWRTGFFSD